MTFKERCKRFDDATERESNIFVRVCRTIFLNKKIEEYEKEENMFKLNEILYNRPKDHSKAKQMIKEEQ